jgi:hypothetical protein
MKSDKGGIGVALRQRIERRKVGTMKSFDHALWDRELAEYISLHPDLEDLPPPTFPRRSRLARGLRRLRRLRQSWRARRRRWYERLRGGYSLIVILVVIETLVLGAILGWWLGWHL